MMNKHDIISDNEFEQLMAQHKRQEKFEMIAIAAMAVALFTVACVPVILQDVFNIVLF